MHGLTDPGRNCTTLRLRALASVAAGAAVFLVAVLAVSTVAKTLLADVVASGVRGRVTVELTGAMLGEVVVLALLLFHLRRRGQGLLDLGLWAASPRRGWVAATVVAALFIGFNLALPLRGQSQLIELSLFHIYNALLVALIAGFVEEMLFRGFCMTVLAAAGFGNVTQVGVSAAVYGVAHAGVAITTGVFSLQMMVSAVAGTAVFGACCSMVYLASRRSLMPVVAAHVAIDLVIEPWLFVVALTLSQAR